MAASPTISSDRFELGERLGAGAFGEVFRAFDREYGSPIALKRFPAQRLVDLTQTRREFERACNLAHPNLVRLYELELTDEHVVITMELVEGAPLVAEHFAADSVPLVGEILDAVAALHSAGIVHRDIKPANILVDRHGRPRLIDFGLAARAQDLSRSDGGTLSGTPRYIPPEVLMGGRASPASDIYSAALTLHETITGRLPFEGSAETSLFGRVSAEAVLDASLPAVLADVLQRALARNPEARPTAAEILRCLGCAHTPALFNEPRAGTFVGRAREIAWLSDACAPEGTLVLRSLAGRTGAGKSALLRAFGAAHPELSFFVASVYEADRLPFKVVHAILAALGPLDDVSEPAATADPEVALVAAVRSVLGASPRRVVLAIDDVHYADLDSARVFGRALRELASARLTVLFTGRSGYERGDRFLRELETSAWRGATPQLELTELTEEDAARLVHEVAPQAKLSAELALSLRHDPLLLTAAAEQGSERPRSLSEILDARLSALPADVRHLAETIATATEPLPLALLRRALVLAPDPQRLVHELRIARLAEIGDVAGGRSVRPYHDRFRAELVRALPERRRAELNRSLGDAYAGWPNGGASAAKHFYDGHAPDRARPLALEAARSARVAKAHEQSARLYDLAARCGALGDERSEIRVGAASSWAAAGRARLASRRYLAAARDVSDSESARRMRVRAAELLLGAGYLDVGTRLIRVLLARHGVRWYPSTLFEVLTAAFWRLRATTRGLKLRTAEGRREHAARADLLQALSTSLGYHQPAMTLALQSRAFVAALDSGEPARVVRAAATELTYGSLTRSSPRRLEGLERLIRQHASAPDADLAFVEFSEGYRRFHLGDFADALARFEAALRLYAARGEASWERNQALIHRLFIRIQLGTFGEVLHEYDEVQRSLAALDDRASRSLVDLAAAGPALMAADRVVEADELTESAIRAWGREVPGTIDYLAMNHRCWLACYRGDRARAHEIVIAAWPRVRWMFAFPMPRSYSRWLRGATALALLAEDPSRRAMQREVEIALKALAREPLSWVAPLRAVLAAGLAHVCGDARAATGEMSQAIEGFSRTGRLAMAFSARRWLAIRERRGTAEVDALDAQLATIGVAHPTRFADVHLVVRPDADTGRT